MRERELAVEDGGLSRGNVSGVDAACGESPEGGAGAAREAGPLENEVGYI